MLTGVDLTREDQSFAYRPQVLTKLFGRTLSPPLDRLGITHGQWRCLGALWERDGVSQSELSDMIDRIKVALERVIADRPAGG